MVGSIVGLDFGTTNSLIVHVDPRSERVDFYKNLVDDRPHPSTVWYRAGEVIIGREARSQLESDNVAAGSFVRSPKQLLARDGTISIDGSAMNPESIVADVLSFLRNDAGDLGRQASALIVERAVMTIPVDLDGAGRRRLREAARKAGIGVVQFVHEPLAALYAWIRAQDDHVGVAAELEGRRVLVFDWGGGTLDLTLCLVRSGRLVQISNAGDNEVGGDFFDEVIRNQVRERHAAEYGLSSIHALETSESRNRLLVQCETAKIALSQRESYSVLVRNYLRGDVGRALTQTVTRAELNTWTQPMVDRGLALIDRLLERNELTAQDIELCLPTGGMVSMPAVREGLVQRFGARCPAIPNGDSIIAEGAAWIAHDALRLSLAKPIELEQPDGGYVELAPEGHRLPIENEVQPIAATQFYCVDPRDGVAHFHFVRPKKLGYGSRNAPRESYRTVSVKVDQFQQPFFERLNLNLSIDHDYVVGIVARSTGRGHESRAEIHDLEFALDLGGGFHVRPPSDDVADVTASSKNGEANIKLRANVTNSPGNWGLVPGDLVDHWRPAWFDKRSNNATERQLAERAYYIPCAICKRISYAIETQGCDQCPGVMSVMEAAQRTYDLGGRA